MQRKKDSDFHPRILEMYDGYVHGKMSKREFLTGAGKYAAVGVTGAMVLESLQPNYALAQQVLTRISRTSCAGRQRQGILRLVLMD